MGRSYIWSDVWSDEKGDGKTKRFEWSYIWSDILYRF